MLIDSFNRTHDYLRVSLTNKCNLGCIYCKPGGLHNRNESLSQMSVGEIEEIVSLFIREGVRKVRLTGGEPLLRQDAGEIIERLSKYPVELVLTTNGTLIHKFISQFI